MDSLHVLANLYNDGALREAYSALPDAPVVEVVAKQRWWSRFSPRTRLPNGAQRQPEENAIAVRSCVSS